MSVTPRGSIRPSDRAIGLDPPTPYVAHRWFARRSVVDAIRSAAAGVRFGHGGFGEAVYYRSYSRQTPAGGQEAWADTVCRVVSGVVEVRHDYYRKHGLPWDEGAWTDQARAMGESMAQMHWLPPGRGLWAMGSEHVRRRGAMALYNCAATWLRGETLATDLEWAMDALMNGVGVGFGVPHPDDDRVRTFKPESPACVYEVPDSREGWAESLRLLVESYLWGRHRVEFDYGLLRPAGAPLKSLGGTSSGPGPLRELHERAREALDRYARGEFGPTRLRADLANMVGCCVVVGNTRRSAEILLGSPRDQEFLGLKQDPARQAWAWMSNNSVVLKTHEDFLRMPEIARLAAQNGEPGFVNLVSTQKFGRFGRPEPDAADLYNPCQPGWATVLTPDGIRTFDDVSVGSTVWSGQRWTKVVKKVSTGTKEVFAYHTRAGTFEGTACHRVIQNGEKVRADEALSIDHSWLPHETVSDEGTDPRDVMDGLVLGDGTVRKASGNLVLLCVGQNDNDYHESEVRDLILEHRPGVDEQMWRVSTTLQAHEIPKTYERRVPVRFKHGDQRRVRGFLRGLYSANGSVVGNARVTLKTTSHGLVRDVQEMLSSIGIRSYHTVNRAHDVEFENGTYACRESYDVNITSDRGLFAVFVGFLHAYKTEKLRLTLETVGRAKKSSYDVVSVEPLGKHPVYDITVDAPEHTYWTGGLLVSNCTEIALEDKEVCNLTECFPTRCQTEDELTAAMAHATLYSSTVALLPTHSQVTNLVIARNRRIGVSLSGVADWVERVGMAKATRLMRDGYQFVREINRQLAREAGVPPSVRVTTVKPSGSISQLVGCSSGVNDQKFRWATRRMRVAADHALAAILTQAGYPSEPDRNEPDRTLVFSFPVEGDSQRSAADVSMWEQALRVCALQREWADNAVSVTIDFGQHEAKDLEHMMASVAPMVKALSVLPRDTHTYAQAPYEEITEAQYREMVASVRPIDWSAFRGDGADEKFCTKESCEVPR